MVGVAFFLIMLFAMFAWFAYVAYKDPAGIFKPRPSQPEARPPEDEPPQG